MHSLGTLWYSGSPGTVAILILGWSSVDILTDSAIRWIDLYPVDSAIGFPNTYLMESAIQYLNNWDLVEMSFICIRIKNRYHINGFAFSHVLKQCIEATWKSQGGGGRTPHMKGVGMLVGNFELNPFLEPPPGRKWPIEISPLQHPPPNYSFLYL